jgi:threonine/homoserine/homoserine lactone efflux protein
MLFILANGIAGRPRAGVAAAFGAATGMVVHSVAVGSEVDRWNPP